MTTLSTLTERVRTANSRTGANWHHGELYNAAQALTAYCVSHAAETQERERLERAVVEADKRREMFKAQQVDSDSPEEIGEYIDMASDDLQTALDALAAWLVAHDESVVQP